MTILALPLRRLYMALTRSKKASCCHRSNPQQIITTAPTSTPLTSSSTIINMDRLAEPFNGNLADFRFGHSEQESTGPDYAQILAEDEAEARKEKLELACKLK